MNHISMKPYNLLLLAALLSILIAGLGIPFGYAQTNLQELQNRVVELERKLADAKARQEKAYNVQMKLEEQEQALAGLANSDKYRIQIVEIRADIKNIRTRIAAIIKEKNDLEENLRLAKELQITLREAQLTVKPEAKIPTNDQAVSELPSAVTEHAHKQDYWQVVNIQVDSSFDDMERDEIKNYFKQNRRINEDIALDIAERFYRVFGGLIVRFVINQKSENNADLDVLLVRRITGSPYKTTIGNFPIMNRSQFKESGTWQVNK